MECRATRINIVLATALAAGHLLAGSVARAAEKLAPKSFSAEIAQLLHQR